MRVYSVRKDSKNGCNSGGVAASAVLMNSSSTSFDGFELSVDMVAVGGDSTYSLHAQISFHLQRRDASPMICSCLSVLLQSNQIQSSPQPPGTIPLLRRLLQTPDPASASCLASPCLRRTQFLPFALAYLDLAQPQPTLAPGAVREGECGATLHTRSPPRVAIQTPQMQNRVSVNQTSWAAALI